MKAHAAVVQIVVVFSWSLWPTFFYGAELRMCVIKLQTIVTLLRGDDWLKIIN